MAEPHISVEDLDDAVLVELGPESASDTDADSDSESEDEDDLLEIEELVGEEAVLEQQEEYIEVMESARISTNGPSNSARPTADFDEEGRRKRRRVEERGDEDTCQSNGEGSQGSQWNRDDIDGLFCPICMECWTNEGEHHICCLPCGHIFGLSCITRWLRQNRNTAKCPQCNRKTTLKDIRKLFAPQIAAIDEESQKRIRSLEAKCTSFEKKICKWRKKESEWKKMQAEFQLKIKQLTKRTNNLEHLIEDLQSRPSVVVEGYQEQFVSGNDTNSTIDSQGSYSSFVLQREFLVDGARIFDIDAYDQVILLARRGRTDGSCALAKISLIPPHEIEDILLPDRTKIVKDLHISPFNRNLVLYASLGKEIAVLSMDSNKTVLSYALPAAPWSCCWDQNSSHYLYAGLQNGSLLAFDVRQTAKPVESRVGLTTNPIHTIHCLCQNSTPSGIRTVLSASSIGVCQWNLGSFEERPSLLPHTENQGVCISLAYCPSSNDIVASYRPRVEISNEVAVSQPPLLSPSPAIGQGVSGSHLHLRRAGSSFHKLGSTCATVSNIRLPKSTIINVAKRNPVFVFGDEVTCGLVLREMPLFTVAQRLRPQGHFICDVKYTSTERLGFLGCLSEGAFQLFTNKLS